MANIPYPQCQIYPLALAVIGAVAMACEETGSVCDNPLVLDRIGIEACFGDPDLWVEGGVHAKEGEVYSVLWQDHSRKEVQNAVNWIPDEVWIREVAILRHLSEDTSTGDDDPIVYYMQLSCRWDRSMLEGNNLYSTERRRFGEPPLDTVVLDCEDWPDAIERAADEIFSEACYTERFCPAGTRCTTAVLDAECPPDGHVCTERAEDYLSPGADGIAIIPRHPCKTWEYDTLTGDCVTRFLECPVSNEYINSYVFSPDGQEVAFVKCPPGQSWGCDLYVADLSLAFPRHMTEDVAAGGLSDWRGEWILFIKDGKEGGPAGAGELHKIRTDSTEDTRVTITPNTVIWGRFVPESSLVYFVDSHGDGENRTYLCNDDGSYEAVEISGDFGWSGAVSPTGDRLLFADAAGLDQPTTLIAVDVDGTNPTTLVGGSSSRFEYVVSPDGFTVAYAALQYPRTGIHVVGIDGTGDAVVTDSDPLHCFSSLLVDGGGRYTSPSPWYPFSPDGEWLLFVRGESESPLSSHIFKARLDGTDLTQISEGDSFDFAPSWSPDNKHVAYLTLPTDAPMAWPWPTQLVISEDF